MDRTDSELMGEFARWVERVVEHFQTRGWSHTRISKESGIGRTMLYRWRTANASQGMPTPQTVRRFCDSLGIPKAEPFAIFGWTEAAPADAVPLPPVVDDDVMAIQEIIDRHDLTADEVEEVRAVLRMMRKRFGQKPPNGGGGEAD